MKKSNANVMKTVLALFFCLLGAIAIWLTVKYSALSPSEVSLVNLASAVMRS